MQRGRCAAATHGIESESEPETMRCVSCQDEYDADDAGTCKECYEEANETEEELKREIEDLKAKVAFLRFWSPLDHHNHRTCGPPVPVPAHKALLVSNPFPTFQWLRAIFFFFWHLIDMNVPWNTHLSFYFWFVG